MQSILLRGDILSSDGLLKNHFLLCERGLIRSISSKKPSVKKTTVFFYLRRFLILPGFIDFHLHGEPFLCTNHFSRFGTTGFLSTIPAISKTALVKRIERIKDLLLKDELPSKILGIHLEGPYLNKEMAGAQNRRFIRKIDLGEAQNIIKRANGLVKIVSLAPELNNSGSLIKMLVKNRVVASFGHTDATFEQAVRAIEKGMRFSTHTFNRMGTLHHRMPGVLGAVLTDDRVFCEVILDGLHINPVLFKILLRCKGMAKIILSSDSIRFEDSIKADQKGSLYRLKSGKITGSNLTMNVALRNAMRCGNLSLKDVVRLATINPARLLGIDSRKGSLEIGKDADIAVVDKDLNVVMTICEGRIVYRK